MTSENVGKPSAATLGRNGCILVGVMSSHAAAFAPIQPSSLPPMNALTQWAGSLKGFDQPKGYPRANGALHMLPPEVSDVSSTLLTAVDIFDGSTVDPVVVSNAFWDGITRQFVSLMIGQFLAVTVFGVVTTFAGSQISKMGAFVSDNIFKQKNGGLKQPPPGYTGGLRVTPDLSKLFLCITIDILGTSSELIPFVGELTDLAWAPIAALLLRNLYGSNVVFALEFAEEILPYTDTLPLATICWVIDTFFPESEAAQLLQLGIYSSKQQQYLDIDVPDANNDDRRR